MESSFFYPSQVLLQARGSQEGGSGVGRALVKSRANLQPGSCFVNTVALTLVPRAAHESAAQIGDGDEDDIGTCQPRVDEPFAAPNAQKLMRSLLESIGVQSML
jgi:hypothetical protein